MLHCTWNSRSGIVPCICVTCQLRWRRIICRRPWAMRTGTRLYTRMTWRRIPRIVRLWWLIWPRCSRRTWRIWGSSRMPWWAGWWRSLLLSRRMVLTWTKLRLLTTTWVWRPWCLTGCLWVLWGWWSWWMIILSRLLWPVLSCFCRKIRCVLVFPIPV